MAHMHQSPSPFSPAASDSSYLFHSPVSVLDQQRGVSSPLMDLTRSEAAKGSLSPLKPGPGWEGHRRLVREPERPLRDWTTAGFVLQPQEGLRPCLEGEEMEDEQLEEDGWAGVPGWEGGESDEEEDLFVGREGDAGAAAVPRASIQQEEEEEEEWEELGMDLEDVLETLREESASPWLRPVFEEVSATAAPVTPSLSPSSSSDNSAASSPLTAASGSDWSGSQSLSGRMERLVHRLRQQGYEASLCTTAWASSQGVPAGSHTFVDVALPVTLDAQLAQAGAGAPEDPARGRVVIDLDFASQFEVVKGTPEYQAFLRRVPAAFAGSEGTLLPLLELLVEAMRMSLAAENLPVAPWRRLRFVNAKWTAVVGRAVPPPFLPDSPPADTSATAGAPRVLGASPAYPQMREEALSQSLPAGQAGPSRGGAPGAAGATSDSLPRFSSGLVNLSSSPHPAAGSAALLAEPALLSALAAKAARSSGASPLHPKRAQPQQQGFGGLPHLRQAGFNGPLSGAAGGRSLRSSLLKDMVACSH